MKEIRAREESLNELQRTRKQLGTKIEAAEKKLSKMNPGHKQLQTQQDVLNQLREEGRQLDDSILAEEASLGDYKRQTTKDMMSVKFGGLCELAEKVMIVGNAGKQLIESIPLEETKPGSHRAPYLARARTTDLLASTGLRIAQVTFQSTHSDFAHRNEPGAAPPQQEPFEKFAEPHNLSEFPGGLSPPRPAFLHARASTTAGEKDSNATSSPHLRSRSLSLPDGFDPDFSPVIQPRASASTFSQLSRPSSMFVSQPGRRPDSMFSDPGTDPASGRLGLSEMTDQMLRSATPTPGRRPDSQAVGFHSIAEEPGRTDGQQAFQPPQSGTAEATLTDQLQIPHIPPPAYSPSDQQTFSANDTQQHGEASTGQSGSPAPNPSQPPPSLSSSSSGGDRKLGFPWMR
ncbi:hypothetical protein FRC01_011629 [Tulasnella sp. 417]|nr:hypothetical protein FRC01_011629 [Tulasnella sp. 417]